MTDRKRKKNEVMAQIREELGLTQQQVADRVGIHTNYYARVERGQEFASVKTYQAIAQVLKINYKDIMPD